MVVGEGSAQSREASSVGSAEIVALDEGVFDAGEQCGGVEEVAVAVATVAGVGGGLEDDRAQRAGYRDEGALRGGDLEDGVHSALQGLSASLDADHVAAAEPLHDLGGGMVGHEYVDDFVARSAGHQVDPIGAADEPMGGVAARVDGVAQAVVQPLQSRGGRVGDAAAGLDVEHDVGVVRRTDDADAPVHGVQLRHQATDEGPPVGGENGSQLRDVRPRR
ncbi:hypothetical protein H9L10_15100 [Phycicoccus endophyticus]|uniref:Uncharacterized protein n=1 Tax=Phycicoccus endophyticus TaxID=1690220 RepID=A0A7G9R1K8_9MICO|nr:hypothetical protein [Phycicoccus endophyticus]QNN49483.1 hypothetical protein H9L10_15100 [Phycicoccus endophyticus]